MVLWLVGAVIGMVAGCTDDGQEVASSGGSAVTTSSAPADVEDRTETDADADDVCAQLAGPVEVLNGFFDALAGPDIEELSSQEAWDRMLAQYEANAAAFTEFGQVVPQLRESADAAAAEAADRAASARGIEPDLELIDRARTANRSRIDPVEVATGMEPSMATGAPASELYGYVERVCPELLGVGLVDDG